MIPAKPGLQVVYYAADNLPYRAEIVAWNSDGRPMVLRGTFLEPVIPMTVQTIVEWDISNPHPDFTQFIPVDDLYVLSRRDDGSLYEETALGWAVTAGGNIVPVYMEDNRMVSVSGFTEDVTAFRERDRDATYALYSRDAEVEADFQAEVDAAKSREV